MINHQPKHERAMLGISIDRHHARRIQWRRISPQIIRYALDVIAMILFALLCYAAFIIIPCLK